MQASWSFPNNNHSVRHGISDSGIETFKGRIEQSLAREICQNSLDAATANNRVKIEFQLHNISSNEFPGKSDFKNALIKAKKSWEDQTDTKTKDFLDSALKTINSDIINVLRISDYNTSGLTGSNRRYNSNWANLIKASGSSDKSSAAGGSFGIGKFATFAASNLRTVFYSTIDEDNLKASQGVSKLVSFPNDEKSDELTQGIGFYGNPEKNDKIPECRSYVSDFKRSEVGTDIFIPGFIVKNQWEEKIVLEILESFLMAIFDGALEIQVGFYTISKETLHDFFLEHKDLISSKSKNLLAQYYALTNENTEWFNYSFIESNDVRIGILVDHENANNLKISMIRRPWMKIYDYRPNNSSYFNFSGICLIKGQKLNALLRKAENPQHIHWEPDRIENSPNERKLVNKYLKEIKHSIIKQINNLISKDSEDESDIEGLSEFLPMHEKGHESKEQLSGGQSFKLNKKTKHTIPSGPTLSEKKEKLETEELVKGGLVEGDDILVNTKHGNGSSSNVNPGDTPKGVDESEDNLILIPQKTGEYELRLFSPTGNHNQLKLVVKTKLSYENMAIKFFKLDEEGKSVNLELIAAMYKDQDVEVSNHTIKTVHLNDEISILDLEFDELFPFSAEVKLYAVKK